MTQTLPPRARITRRLAAIAAVTAVGALGPVAIGAPAVAAPTGGPCPAGFGATAASELLTLRALDAQPLGALLPPVASIHLGPTESGMAGDPARAAAQAQLVKATVLGLSLPDVLLGEKVYQQAPPPNAHGVARHIAGADLGVLDAGVGSLAAHATWQDASRCDPGSGPASESSSSTARLDVLPTAGDQALLRVGALQTATATGVASIDGKPAAVSTATGSVASIELFGGTAGAVSVKVVSQPTLEVAAGATKTIRYQAPVLRVVALGKPAVDLSSAGSHVDLVITNPAVNATANTLTSGTGGVAHLTDPVHALIGSLPVPAVSSLLDEIGSLPAGLGGAAYHPGGNQSVVLRLSLGTLTKETTSTGVHATTASIRVQLLLRTAAATTDGYGGGADQDVTLLDAGLCVLDAAAAAPAAPAGGYGGTGSSGGYGGVSGSGSGGGGHGTGSGQGGGSLPVTGSRVSIVVTAGIVLVLAGRLLLVASRRRRAALRGTAI